MILCYKALLCMVLQGKYHHVLLQAHWVYGHGHEHGELLAGYVIGCFFKTGSCCFDLLCVCAFPSTGRRNSAAVVNGTRWLSRAPNTLKFSSCCLFIKSDPVSFFFMFCMLVPVMQFVEEQLKSKKVDTSVVGFPKWKCIVLVLPKGVITVMWISAYFCL